MRSEDKYVLITGSGAGFGKSLAQQLASRGYNLLLVALSEPQLESTKKELLKQYPDIKIHCLVKDLLKDNVHVEIYDWVKLNNYRLTGLINNVGFGYQGAYESVDPVFFENMLRLNVMLTHNMCKQFINELKANAPGFIHNVASLAGFYPMPYKTVYVASKSFVLIYSRALREEMKPYGIKVSCCCPGPMLTNFAIRKRLTAIGRFRKALIGIADPDDIAKITVKRMFNGEGVIIPAFKDRLMLSFSRLMPFSLLSALLGRASQDSYN